MGDCIRCGHGGVHTARATTLRSYRVATGNAVNASPRRRSPGLPTRTPQPGTHLGNQTATQDEEPVRRSAIRFRAARSRTPDQRRPFALRSVEVGALLAVASVAYSMWLLEFVLPTGLSPVQSFVSEHYVVSEPYQALFRGFDVVAGIVYVVASVRLRRLLPSEPSGASVAIGLGVFGLTTVIDALFVPDCIATINPVCERLELTGHVSWHHLLHLGSSFVSQLAFIVVALGIQHLATLRGTARERILTRLLLALLLIAGLACLTCYQVGWVGIPQRIQLIVIAAGTMGAAVWLLCRHVPDGRDVMSRQ